jgi:hypothetical protein
MMVPKLIMEADVFKPDTRVSTDVRVKTVNVMKNRKPSKVKVIMQTFQTGSMRTASDLHNCGTLKMKQDNVVWTNLETP